MIELLTKGYVDFNKKINVEKIEEFYQEYPEFNTQRLAGNKIIDKNKNIKNTIKIRKAQFEELKELWTNINKKYILFFNKEVDKLIEEELPQLLEKDVFGLKEITSIREQIQVVQNGVEVVNDAGVTYFVTGRKLPYNVFLKRINKSTAIPIKTLHTAIVVHAKKQNNFKPSFINESSMSRFIAAFNDWKYDKLQGRFNYKQTTYNPIFTKFTNADGTIKDEIVQGEIGIHLDKGTTSAKYLYDVVAYDSPLERKNIIEEIHLKGISEVVVYGKIPRRSIAIPTIGHDSYSPDFMYVVKKENGQKELNIIVETKDVEGKSDLRGEEAMKISCAETFFKQLTIDGYNVSFKTQLNNKGVATIISEIINL